MTTFLRSRQQLRPESCGDTESSHSSPQPTLPRGGSNNDKKFNKNSTKITSGRNRVFVAVLFCLLCWHLMFFNLDSKHDVSRTKQEDIQRAPMGNIVYGTKSKGEDTSRFVKEAIQAGFRHIATVSNDGFVC